MHLFGRDLNVLREPGFFVTMAILFVILGLADAAIWQAVQVCCNPS
jgi:hypothetical protein